MSRPERRHGVGWSETGRCAACADGRARAVAQIAVQGRPVPLCRRHLAELGVELPGTLSELGHRLGVEGIERRLIPDRRGPCDRRALPPRPETRRCNCGRRASDPQY
ncbi:MAG: hypothetical protein HY744_20560 [Deltaproteobacteria bacterium]|nr:hypothetical protein [Deltaproteobacteria bacterium]